MMQFWVTRKIILFSCIFIVSTNSAQKVSLEGIQEKASRIIWQENKLSSQQLNLLRTFIYVSYALVHTNFQLYDALKKLRSYFITVPFPPEFSADFSDFYLNQTGVLLSNKSRLENAYQTLESHILAPQNQCVAHIARIMAQDAAKAVSAQLSQLSGRINATNEHVMQELSKSSQLFNILINSFTALQNGTFPALDDHKSPELNMIETGIKLNNALQSSLNNMAIIPEEIVSMTIEIQKESTHIFAIYLDSINQGISARSLEIEPYSVLIDEDLIHIRYLPETIAYS